MLSQHKKRIAILKKYIFIAITAISYEMMFEYVCKCSLHMCTYTLEECLVCKYLPNPSTMDGVWHKVNF